MQGCTPEWFEALSASFDGEATAEEASSVEAHLATCAACAEASSALDRLRGALAPRRDAERDAPAALRVREAVLARAGAERDGKRQRRVGRRWAVGGALAAAAAAVMLLASPRGGMQSAMATELVSHHLRGFARERPCEIESSDPSEISRWVQDRLGYRVDVKTPAGAQLIGARVCNIDGTRTAALMYRRDDVPLTIFAPPPGSEPAVAAARLARGDVGCTQGPLGSAICAVAYGEPALAVTESDAFALESALAQR